MRVELPFNTLCPVWYSRVPPSLLARGLLWSIFVSTQAAAALHCAWRLGSRRGARLLERLHYARACLDISFAAAGVLLA